MQILTRGIYSPKSICSMFGSELRGVTSQKTMETITHTTTENRCNFNKNIRKYAFKVDNAHIAAIKVRAFNNVGQTLEATCTAAICWELSYQELYFIYTLIDTTNYYRHLFLHEFFEKPWFTVTVSMCHAINCRVLNEFFQFS